VIVESPAKAKTIEKILGKDFSVKSSYGHVRDLKKGNGGVDIDNNFTPAYEVTADKEKVVKELKSAVAKVSEVWLATDEDREGEAISWHLCEVLGLDEKTTKRIVFREITKPAIQSAIQSPRLVDINLVNAQQARRILDRLVGFDLSGLLWRKVKGKLSAGRVQSVAVKLIVERERQIIDFKAEPFFRVNAIFLVKNEKGKLVELKAELGKRLSTQKDAETFLEACKASKFNIGKIEKKPVRRKPTAPFTTSTLQQDASRKLGFSVKRTMVNAQKLYEQGMITYMRTDSVNLSETAIASIAKEIENKYGKKYLHTRRFKTKKSNAQEAHEAIRPTYIERNMVGADRDQQRLYELIWKRTIASQMAEAELEKTIVRINISELPDDQLKAEGEVLIFDGFLKVYLESQDDDDDEGENKEASGILPPLSEGQQLNLGEMVAMQRFTRPPARYTEAGLVKKMEELGIGRPSTYAPTISKIMEPARGYVYKGNTDGDERKYQVLTLSEKEIKTETRTEMTGAIKNRLVPSDMGMVVTQFLDKNFDEVMDYGFTAGIEKKFDQVAAGTEGWTDLLGEFYGPFHKTVAETLDKAERADGERILGKDPETGLTLLVRMTRLGRPVVQIGSQTELTEDQKPKYANLRPGQRLETLTAEEALKLFDLPKDLGLYEEKMLTVAVGRYGPYVKHGEIFISIPKGEDPMELNRERAIELVEEKKIADAPVHHYQSEPVTKGKGRFGPFLKYKGMYINIPKRYDPENLSVHEMDELIEKKIEKEANRFVTIFEGENIAIENGRWGPFIRFKKKSIKLPKIKDKRMTSEEAKLLTLEEVKKIIVEEIPNAFPAKKKKATAKKKKATTKKKAAPKKKVAAKATAKKSETKK